jgi:hypothetical protein
MSYPSIAKYPLDLTGTALTNRITGELKTIPLNRNRAFALYEGPFYGESLVLTRLPGGETLTQGTDYQLLYLYSDATIRSSKPVYAIVNIINPAIEGALSCDYQVIGGTYSSNFAAIQLILDALNLDDRPVQWQNIVGLPVQFPPSPHLHHASELYGMEHVVNALTEILNAMGQGNEAQITEILTRLGNVENAYNSILPNVNKSVGFAFGTFLSVDSTVQVSKHYHVGDGLVATLPAIGSVALGDKIVFSQTPGHTWTLQTPGGAELLEWWGVTDTSALCNLDRSFFVMKTAADRWSILE